MWKKIFLNQQKIFQFIKILSLTVYIKETLLWVWIHNLYYIFLIKFVKPWLLYIIIFVWILPYEKHEVKMNNPLKFILLHQIAKHAVSTFIGLHNHFSGLFYYSSSCDINTAVTSAKKVIVHCKINLILQYIADEIFQ